MQTEPTGTTSGRGWGAPAAGATAGAILAAGEIVSLRTVDLGLWWVSTTLLVVLGAIVGVVIAFSELLVERLQLRPARAALVLAAGSVVPFVLLGSVLFDGARAQTLPGAGLAPIWVPVVGWLGVSGAVGIARRLAGHVETRRRIIAAALAALVVAIELANRNLYRSGYPLIHVVLTIASLAAATSALRLAAPGLGTRGPRWVRPAIAAAVALSLLLALTGGLASPSSRWAVATRGVHTRQLARIVRLSIDLDGDGYSAVLGGPDCDDGDAAVHPLAIDRADTPIDEDCDGVPAAPPAPPAEGDAASALDRFAARPEVAARLAQARGMNVLLVTIDALRGDSLADTPDNRRDLPNLFALMDESRVFRRAFSTSAGTDVAIPALVSGRVNPFTTVETTLAESMQATGRATHAVIPTEVLRWVGRHLITRGFGTVDRLVNDRGGAQDVGGYTTSAQTTDLGLAFLDRPRSSPFFLWLHYFDVHEHHQIHADDPALRRVASGRSLDRAGKYRALAMIVDRELGRLVGELERRGEWDRTIVVMTSDHGESLGEDPRLPDNHGELVYNPLVHVPLAIRVPGVPPGTVDRTVSLVDVAPTIAALAGGAKLPGADGLPLLGHLFPSPDAPPASVASRPAVLNESSQIGIVVWPYKLLVRPAENLTELYDLSSDFDEKHDLSTTDPDRARQLMLELKRYPPLSIDRSARGRRTREEAGRAPPRR